MVAVVRILQPGLLPLGEGEDDQRDDQRQQGQDDHDEEKCSHDNYIYYNYVSADIYAVFQVYIIYIKKSIWRRCGMEI